MIEPMIMAGKRENHWISGLYARSMATAQGGDVVIHSSYSVPALHRIALDGEILWSRQINPNGRNYEKLIVASDGSIYFVHTYSSLSYLEIVKLGGDGSFQWSKLHRAVSSTEVRPFMLAEDKTGNIVVGGYHEASSSYTYTLTTFRPNGTVLSSLRTNGWGMRFGEGRLPRAQSGPCYFEIDNGQITPIADFGNNAVIEGTEEGEFFLFTGSNLAFVQNGVTQWSKFYSAISIRYPVLNPDGTIFLCDYSGTPVLKIRKSDGQVVWARDVNTADQFRELQALGASEGDYWLRTYKSLCRLPGNGEKTGNYPLLTYQETAVAVSEGTVAAYSMTPGTLPGLLTATTSTSATSELPLVSIAHPSFTKI